MHLFLRAAFALVTSMFVEQLLIDPQQIAWQSSIENDHVWLDWRLQENVDEVFQLLISSNNAAGHVVWIVVECDHIEASKLDFMVETPASMSPMFCAEDEAGAWRPRNSTLKITVGISVRWFWIGSSHSKHHSKHIKMAQGGPMPKIIVGSFESTGSNEKTRMSPTNHLYQKGKSLTALSRSCHVDTDSGDTSCNSWGI